MATKIQVRRDTAANWRSANPVLSQGEPALELDTGVVKYGDGVTAWNDLGPSGGGNTEETVSNGNKAAFRTVSGVKSFKFRTAGHIRTDFRVPASQAGNVSSLNVSITEHPTIIDSVKTAWDNWNDGNGGQPYFYINQNWTWFINSYSITNDVMTINLGDGPYTLAENELVTFVGWSKGTQATYASYRSTYAPYGSNLPYDGHYWGPVASVSNTNSVQVDLTNENSDYITALKTQQKNFIVFDEFTQRDGRRIVSATQNGSSNTYTIVFSGPPRDVLAKTTKTLEVKASRNIESFSYLYVSGREYPQLINYLQDGNGTITINGGSPVSITGFWPRGGGDNNYYGMDYRGEWVIGLGENVNYTTTDNIVMSYTDKGTFIRMDYYVPNISYSTPNTTGNNGYRWFNWNEDLPFFKAINGNGVQGGWLDLHVQVSWPLTQLTRGSDNRTFSVFFDPKGPGYYGDQPGYNQYSDPTGLNDYRIQGFPTNSGPGNPAYYGGLQFGGPWYDLQFNVLYEMYEDGIFFHAHHNYYDNNISQELEVDIVWSTRLFYADVPQVEPNDI